MKANREIDELLCSFIDGELPLRQQTEVQRLAARDPEVGERLRQLQNCQNLVTALPRAEAPEHMLEQIKVSLERRTLLEERPVQVGTGAGARHLRIRRFVAAAAMIALLGGLGAVIYQIVAPVAPTGSSGVFAEGERSTGPVVTVEREAMAARQGFSGTLELSTASFVQADSVVRRAIEENGLSDLSESEMRNGSRVYRIDTTRAGLNRLVADLGRIWQNFESATLMVQTESFAKPVVVEQVTLQQAAQIIDQDSTRASVALANEVVAFNSFAREMPGRGILPTAGDGLGRAVQVPDVPRPIRTSDDVATKAIPTPPEGKVKASLIIVLLNTQ